MLASACLMLAASGCARREPLPHLVLISVDTLNRSALRAFDAGAPALPRLDALAAESVRFERAISTSSWTLPAHASLLTGRYPHRHGATDPNVLLDPGVPTLAETLRGLGYETVAVTGGGFVRSEFGLARGFDRYLDWTLAEGPLEQAAASLFDRAAAVVAQRGAAARPLFLFAHTFAVHDYYYLHPWAVERLAERPARTIPEYGDCLDGGLRCDDADWATLRALYAAELAHLDAGIGRLLDALAAAGMLEKSVVVLTSDHGEGFDPARSRIHHGGRLHADVLRVPLLVRMPGAAGRAVDAPVSLADVAPTLVELAGGAPLAGSDGVSLAAALRGGALDRERALYAEEHAFSWWSGARLQSRSVQARPLSTAVVRGDRWYLRSGDREELYDWWRDPGQAHDIAAGAPERAALRDLADRVGERPATPLLGQDEDLRDQLRALGYAE
jgi:arylsulfatase A-like enzyme